MLSRFSAGGLSCIWLLCAGAAPALGAPPGEAQERVERDGRLDLRLSEVGQQTRTRGKGRREGWSEALPGQPLPPRTQLESGASEGAEIDLGGRGRAQLAPGTLVLVERAPGRRGSGALQLLRGALQIDLHEGAPPLQLRAGAARVTLAGAAYLEADEGGAAVAVYGGEAEVRGRGKALRLQAGQGVRLGRGRAAAVRTLPTAPRWEDGGPRILVAAGPLPAPRGAGEAPAAGAQRGEAGATGTAAREAGAEPLEVAAALPFSDVSGGERYRVEVTPAGRSQRARALAELGYPPYRGRLQAGAYQVRATALGPDRLPGPSSPPLSVRVVELRSDAQADEAQGGPYALRLRRRLGAQLRVSGGGAPLRGRLDDGPEVDCRSGASFTLGPGEHRLQLAEGAARALVRIDVEAPPRPKAAPPPKVAAVLPAPLGLPVPLTTAGFPSRALQPRTRAFALLGVGASAPGRTADVYRLDLGAEVAFFKDSFSVDLDLPVLYQRFDGRAGSETGQFALGDVQVGFRAVAVRLLDGQMAIGPLLRLQLPTGTFSQPEAPGPYPVILDPAVALAGVVGPVALQTTQGPTAVLAVPKPELRWSMSYAAELRLRWLGIHGELDAALGMGGATSGAALGGGLRIKLPGTDPRRGHWSLLAGARGGLGEKGEAMFGRYQVTGGVEWRLK